MEALLKLFLMLVTLIVLVPAFTQHAVHVPRNGLFRGIAALIGIGVVNWFIWSGAALLSLGLIIPLNFMTLGIIGILFNGLAFLAIGRMFPSVLYVRGFEAAVLAAVVTTLASFVIERLL
ncbi:MAG: phage holin family protein [Candidatus Melainabacteria bacterium]|jgi:uncharacterized membrane protein YvlD (DUF360 family)|nr:phage holin family protein [Candidatus Melainabacteria bacterium]